MNRTEQLGIQPIGKLLLKFSIPATIGMLVNALYNIVDRIFIGHGVGALALAGVTVAFPIMTIIMALGMLIGIGGGALTSIKLGQQNKEEADKILGNAVTLFLGFSLATMSIGLIFLNPILSQLGASKEVLPYAEGYTRVILLGVLFQYFSFGMNNFVRVEGNPHIAMVTMLIGAILNSILNPIFIYSLDMGVKGAAWATVLSQGVTTIWIFYHFLSSNSILHLKKENLKLDIKRVKKILAIGSAPASVQLGASLVGTITNINLKVYGGNYAQAAMGAIMSIGMVFLMPIFGINQGAQPIIGYNYGAGFYGRVKRTLLYAIGAATIFSTIGFIAVERFPHAFIMMFNKNPKMLSIGVEGIQIYLFMLPVIGFQIVSANYFQAVGKPQKALTLSLLRQVVILIPLLYILPKYLGLRGVWLSAPISDLIAVMITFFVLRHELRQLK